MSQTTLKMTLDIYSFLIIKKFYKPLTGREQVLFKLNTIIKVLRSNNVDRYVVLDFFLDQHQSHSSASFARDHNCSNDNISTRFNGRRAAYGQEWLDLRIL